MRRIITAAAGTVGGLALLFSYPTSTNSGGTATTSGTSASTASSTGSSGSSGSSSSGTYTGDAVMTRWGVVQVEITVENGRITKSEAVQYPQDNPKDVEINSYALPVLAEEVTAAQSADIDAVSGATVTSDGYVQSLQSAIDQAHL
ncbi:MAG: FMN-binding protein [Actinobacteria bacterium]|nr:FMN-binding protein [Actinomycetota bacterium]